MIKQDPELRHFLRHVLYAIEELARGHKSAALYEIESIQSLVSWGDDDKAFRRFTKREWKEGDSIEKEEKNGRQKRRRQKVSVAKTKRGARIRGDDAYFWEDQRRKRSAIEAS